MNIRTLAVISAFASVAVANATLYNMNFDTDSSGNAIASGATIAGQYSGWGFAYTPNPFSGGAWATNTGMTATSTDVGGGYSAAHKNVLHSFSSDWLAEDGDPDFLITSTNLFDSVKMTFVGDSSGASGFGVYDAGGNLLASIFVPVTANSVDDTVSLSGFGLGKFIAVLPGSFGDWVAVDDVMVNVVPEPTSFIVVGIGVAAVALRRRNKK